MTFPRPLPQLLNTLWETWDLRFFIILSLSLQAFLILVAPLRKKIRAYWITMTIWSAYLLADWTANFAVGQIASSQGMRVGSIKKGDNADILAFWAPFLLVHLGGPDTITAFSLEDNELWIRHLLGLIFQSGAAVYVFYLSLPKNQIWLPTVFMFISGIIKYGERTKSLYLASLNRFRDSMLDPPDPGPNYAKIMSEYDSKKEANLPTDIVMIAEPARGTKTVNETVKTGKLTDREVVLHAHEFYNTFKGLIVNLIFSLHERNQTRDFFLQRTSADAFKVIEVELNLIYDVLYSKVSVVYTNFGYFFRFISFSLVFTSLGLFYCEDKSNFEDPDVTITYTLLLGAIALDVIAFIQLVTSVWLIVARKKLPDVDQEDTNKDSQESDAEKTSEESGFGCFRRIEQVLHRRWSESISGYNLIFYCLKARPPVQAKLIDSLGLTSSLDEMKYVKQYSFTKELRDHIFKELKTKSEMADDLDNAKEISSARGDWILQHEGCPDELLPYVNQVSYDESLLLWHIATELCHADESKNAENPYKEFSKRLSDYMLYLLVMQPKMMSAVAGIGQIRFRDTCAETKKFFVDWREKRPNGLEATLYAVSLFFKYLFLGPFLMLRAIIALIIRYPRKKEDLEEEQRFLQRTACRRILNVNTEKAKPVTIKGDRSKSVLFDGCILAKKLKKLREDKKWEIMSKVWVEMMCYAAIHCSASSHAQRLSNGGELVTIVWFLMAHFGLCDRFQIKKGHGRAKLIVDK